MNNLEKMLAGLRDDVDQVGLPTRSLIEGLAMRGQITPEQAEEWARDHGKPPFEERPDPAKFDPMTVDDWTLGMATAWIVWRTPDAVRDVWSDFASGCWEWQPYSHREAWEHAPEGIVHAKGSKLEQRKAKSPDEVSLRATVSEAMGNSGMGLSAEDAESALRAALRQGDKLVARHGRRAEPIDKHLWAAGRLSPFACPRARGSHDAVYDGNGEVAFKSVTVERDAVLSVWPPLPAAAPIAIETDTEGAATQKHEHGHAGVANRVGKTRQIIRGQADRLGLHDMNALLQAVNSEEERIGIVKLCSDRTLRTHLKALNRQN